MKGNVSFNTEGTYSLISLKYKVKLYCQNMTCKMEIRGQKGEYQTIIRNRDKSIDNYSLARILSMVHKFLLAASVDARKLTRKYLLQRRCLYVHFYISKKKKKLTHESNYLHRTVLFFS